MKQKEITRFKRNFSLGNERLTVKRFATGVIENKEMRQFNIREFSLFDETEQTVYMKLLKESLGGKVGKALLEYPVPMENFKNGSGIQKLYELKNDGLFNEDLVKETMMELADKSLYTMPICITMAHLIYNIPAESEDAMEEDDEDFYDDGEVFEFIICNIVPLNFPNAELYFSEKKMELLRRKEEDGSLVLADKATDSIMYPVLNDNESDVNYVIYKTKEPKNPNSYIIEEFLQCKYTMSGVDEQNRITEVLYGTFGEELDYETVVGLKKEIKQIEVNDAENPEVTKVNVKELSKTIANMGFDENTVEKFEKKYEDAVGEDVDVKSVNVINTETTVYKTKGVKVTVKQNELDKVSIENVSGRRCIVIEIEEGLKVDDILVK